METPTSTHAPERQLALPLTTGEVQNSKGIPPVLTQKEWPYLLTILLAAIAWTLTRSVDRLLESPTIEYSIVEYPSGTNRLIRCIIENISNNKCFKDLRFSLNRPVQSKGGFSKARLKPIAPATCDEDVTELPDSLAWTIPEMHPGWRFEVSGTMTEAFIPFLTFETTIHDNDSDIQAVRVVQQGTATWLIKHEMILYLMIIATFVGVFLVYLPFLLKHHR